MPRNELRALRRRSVKLGRTVLSRNVTLNTAHSREDKPAFETQRIALVVNPMTPPSSRNGIRDTWRGSRTRRVLPT